MTRKSYFGDLQVMNLFATDLFDLRLQTKVIYN